MEEITEAIDGEEDMDVQYICMSIRPLIKCLAFDKVPHRIVLIKFRISHVIKIVGGRFYELFLKTSEM